MLQRITNLARRMIRAAGVMEELETVKIMLGRQLSLSIPRAPRSLRDVEFRVFSQWGDDGIIQYLVRELDLPPHLQTFVEFGVENYAESNTRFLMMSDNWRGLVMDGNPANVTYIKGRPWYWRHDLTAVTAFIDCDNIDGLLTDNGFSGKIGLLHVDIDGNDYWVWKCISSVDPILVIVEYNSVFGCRHAVTVPYDPAFQRNRAHHSNLYFGASLPALAQLGREKGYAFVGCNNAGNNAYFVQREFLGRIPEVAVETGYVESRFRDSRDANGELTLLSGARRLQEVGHLPVVLTDSGKTITIAQLYGI